MRSRNDFDFVPRYDFSTVPQLDRMLVRAGPDSEVKRQVIAAWSPDEAHRAVDDIFQNVPAAETASEATFQDLARTQGPTLSRNDASLWFYVMDPSRLQGSDWTLPDVVTPLLISLFGAAVVYSASHLKLPRRTRYQAIPQPA